MLSGCGLYDLSWRAKIAVTGGDRVRWMNGMVTNNVRDLAAGHGVYAFMLNAQGRIQADLYVFQRGESLLVDTERGQRDKILQLFDRYIIADDVEIADVSDKLTAARLDRTGIARGSRTCGHRRSRSRTCSSRTSPGSKQLRHSFMRSGEEARESWQIWIAPEHVAELWDALVKGRGAAHWNARR